jgi:hypothetical protein
MPTANVRYGRPRGTGRDDRQQLDTLAALLAANPRLKPTTAIRSLGVQDPSTIRRLRDKFRVEQASLRSRAAGMPGPHLVSNENTPPAEQPIGEVEQARAPLPSEALFGGLCDLGFSTLRAAAECQAAFAQYWLGFPAVSAALRYQLALHSMAVAMHTRTRRRRRIFH